MKSLRWHLFLFLLLSSSLALAQTSGKISGIIIDKDTGAPLAGVNVIVDGTTRGAATDMNGRYFIMNMPPGRYVIKARFIGFKIFIINEVRVSVNRTVTLDMALEETVLEGEAVVITADPLSMRKDQTSSVRNVSAEDIALLPVETTGGIVAIQPGVVLGHVRGGRSGEVATLIDGVSVNNGMGGSMISVDPDAVQEVEVISGTFNAKYGEAMSGIVNMVTKEGTERFSGSIKGYFGNYFTANDDIFIGLRPAEVDRNKDIKFTFSGPLFSKKLSFFINGWIKDNNGYLNGIYRFNVTDQPDYSADTWLNPQSWNGDSYLHGEHSGNGKYVPMSWSQSQRFSGKLTYRLSSMKMNAQYIHNVSTGQGYNHGRRFAPYGRSRYHSTSQMFKYTLNHFISNRAFYELKLAYNRDAGGNYLYDNPLDNRYLHSKYSANSQGTGFLTGGQEKGYSDNVDEKYSARLDFNWQATDHHNIEAGFDYSQFILDHNSYSIMNVFENTPAENYIFAPEVRSDSTIYTDHYREKPYRLAAWLTDKMEFQNMVLNVGVRIERFDANTTYPSNYRNPANLLSKEGQDDWNSQYLKSKPKFNVAPRLSFSYQLAKVALLRFSYGHFYQYPSYGTMYLNNSYVISPTDFASRLGNPEVKAQKTVNYEVGLWQQLNSNFDLELALWYKDIYNLSTVNIITTYDNHQYGLYGNKDYGNARGLELKLHGQFDNFYTDINYTLQYTRGNADSPTQNFSRAGGDMDPISILIPMSWDQRHTLNATMGYNTSKYGLTVTGYFGSGSSYSWSPIDQNPLSRIYLLPNNQKRPFTFSMDLKAQYKMGRYYGMDVVWELYVYNVLDRLNEYSVDSRTGRANQSIIRDSDRAAHFCDFASYEERIYSPTAYSAPRMIKLGFGIKF